MGIGPYLLHARGRGCLDQIAQRQVRRTYVLRVAGGLPRCSQCTLVAAEPVEQHGRPRGDGYADPLPLPLHVLVIGLDECGCVGIAAA
jgi:hypothetical protein